MEGSMEKIEGFTFSLEKPTRRENVHPRKDQKIFGRGNYKGKE